MNDDFEVIATWQNMSGGADQYRLIITDQGAKIQYKYREDRMWSTVTDRDWALNVLANYISKKS